MRLDNLAKKQTVWKLYTSEYGFTLSRVSPWLLLFYSFVTPFTRFYFEGYFQTVLLSDTSKIAYQSFFDTNGLEHNYWILSKFYEMAANLGGVSQFILKSFIIFACTLLFLKNISEMMWKIDKKYFTIVYV